MARYCKSGPEFHVNAIKVSQTKPAVAALAPEGFVITWTNNGCIFDDPGGQDVWARTFGVGRSIQSGFMVNSEAIDHQCDPKVAGLLDGGFVTVWQDFSGRGGDESGSSIKAKVFGGSGELLRDEFLVNVETKDNQSDPDVAALAHGGFVVVWQDFSGMRGDDSLSSIKVRLFGPDGLACGDEFLVNTHTNDHQGHPSVAALVGGGFVVAWHDFSGTLGDSSWGSIKAKIFGPEGEVVRDEFLVNTRTWNNQNTPVVVGLEHGGFVVAWTDSSGAPGDQSGTSVKARLFDELGESAGKEFLVNSEVLDNQLRPALAPLPNGGFVVVWTDCSGRGGDTSGSGIKAKIFGPNGKTAQGEFLVNTEIRGDQKAPAVACCADGNLIIAWQDGSCAQPGERHTFIKAQIFTPEQAAVFSLLTLGSPRAVLAWRQSD